MLFDRYPIYFMSLIISLLERGLKLAITAGRGGHTLVQTTCLGGSKFAAQIRGCTGTSRLSQPMTTMKRLDQGIA
jgi:hypothetical protein